MSVRYTDMGLEAIGARDFVARSRTPTFTQVGLVIFSGFLIGVSLIFSIHNKSALLLTLVALFSILGTYIILHLMRARDMMLITEFQNALFASAMGLHNKFCIIIKRDGSIVYIDRSFQNLFPDIMKHPGRSVEMLLKQGKTSKIDTDRVITAIDKGSYEKVIFDITDAQGIIHRIVLSIEPIIRPSGFTMLRGREFVEDRSSKIASSGHSGSNLFSRSSFTLFSHVIENMKMGIYISSPTGNLVYCNPLLEAWLGYDEGEITSRNMNISNLIHPQRNPALPSETVDFEGEVTIEKKVGGFVKAFLNQHVILNDDNQVIGCTALVHLLHEKPTESSPKNHF